MNIETSKITKIKITDLINSEYRLDPVTVIIEDLEVEKGKIIIECYGESWSAYWGGMGNRSISEFFCSCDEHYLAGNLSSLRSVVVDYENLTGWLNEGICRMRRQSSYLLTKEKARSLWETVSLFVYNEESCVHTEKFSELASEIIGDEWWRDLPEVLNPKYAYLCRVIKATKAALKQAIDVAA